MIKRNHSTRLEGGSLMREVSLVRNAIKRIDDQTKSFNFDKVLNFVKVFQYNTFGYSIKKKLFKILTELTLILFSNQLNY